MNSSLPATSLRYALVLLALMATSAPALSLPPTPPPGLDPALRDGLAWQLALEQAGFSPGVIDGKPGPKTSLATMEYQRAFGLLASGKLDAATAGALRTKDRQVVTRHTVADADAAMVKPTPKGWLAKSEAQFLGYSALSEAVCERFHCSPTLLATLNKGTDLSKLKTGDIITVPQISDGSPVMAHRLEINLSQKVIRIYTAEGALAGLFHCSIAADPARRPSGEARIIGVTTNPQYSFDPAMWPEVKDVKRKLQIPPGPKNPVGLCWIGLSLSGYGIHGTPNPENIGKTGSHGCFRLTNWDALRLGKMVRAGTMVAFVS